jgi:hypothetical protein
VSREQQHGGKHVAMSNVRLPEREKLRRLASPGTFLPEIWWVGVWRSKALRAGVGLPIPKVESVAQPGVEARCWSLLHIDTRRRAAKRSWEKRSVRVCPAVSAARHALRRAGRSVVNTLEVSQGHERPPVSRQLGSGSQFTQYRVGPGRKVIRSRREQSAKHAAR